MNFNFFSKNGEILPITEAVIPVSSIEYAYGFGVYETIRVSNRMIYFLNDHLGRLAESAETIGLEHNFTSINITSYISELIRKNEIQTCNIKILLIGAMNKENAQLFILALNPLYPDRKLYREGADVITYNYVRAFPHAKTLNMLQSYLAYKKAKEAGCYDALLVNNDGNITEGTRTNFFCIKDNTIYTPPESEILLGVTRKAVLKTASVNGYKKIEKNIGVGDIQNYDGAFITSTSSKIMPVKKINDRILKPIPENLLTLMKLYDEFLYHYAFKNTTV